jgi:hypothetical protein
MIKFLIRGCILGGLTAVILLSVNVAKYISRSRVFDQVELNMPEDRANQILQARGIYCNSTPSTYRCVFDDFWRVYTVTISGPEHVVTRKAFVFKRRSARWMVGF